MMGGDPLGGFVGDRQAGLRKNRFAAAGDVGAHERTAAGAEELAQNDIRQGACGIDGNGGGGGGGPGPTPSRPVGPSPPQRPLRASSATRAGSRSSGSP